MDDIFYIGDHPQSVIITFQDDIVAFNVQDFDFSLLLYSRQLWQILAFALDNGLELPKESNEIN